MKIELTSTKIADIAYLRSVGLQPDEIIELYSISKSLHKLAEHDCNFGLTDRQEARRNRLGLRVIELADKAKAKATIHTDPRSGRGLDFTWAMSGRCEGVTTHIWFFV
jgi:hypothetical protein